MRKKATLLFSFIILVFSTINLFAQLPVITKQPHSHGVIVGQTATFSVLASGSGLTYQWYLNDTPISGATDSVYTTPATVIGHNGEQFHVIVSNLSGNDTSNTATLYVTAAGSRVTGSQIALYNFKEGKGTAVKDVSGFGTPVNLTINNPSSVDWSNSGLYVHDGAMIQSSYLTTDGIIDAIRTNDELTLELWIRPVKAANSRIFDLTSSTVNVDFGVESVLGKGYNFVVRTTTTDNLGIPGVVDNQGISTDLIQVTYTRSSDGICKIYRDGVVTETDTIAGDMHTWIYQAIVSLGSFLNGTNPFDGIYYLASISDRALDSIEVAHNYSVGVSGTNLPFIVQEPQTAKVLVGFSGIFMAKAVGDGSLSYQWQKNGANITGATDSVYTTPAAALIDSGDVYRVIVTNSSGSDTSSGAVLDVKGVSPDCPNGITHYYHLDEASSPYKDTVGFSDATSSTSPASVTGVVKNAVDFTSDEKIDIPTDNSFNWKSTDSFSLEFWMKTNSSPTDVNVAIGRDDGNTGIQWYAGYNASGKATFFLRNTSNEFNTVSGGPNINDNKWHLIVAIRNASVNKLYLYVDGSVIDSAAQTYTTGFDGASHINLGYLDISPFYYFSGSLDEVAIYNAALSQSEIWDQYYKGLKGYGYCEMIPPIPAPTNLKAIKDNPDTTNVKLSWDDNSSNELGFILQRKLGDSASVAAYSSIDTLAANTTSYVDSTTADTTKYTYRIYAYNNDTVSAYSNHATITTALPVELTSFTANMVNGKVMLTWATATEINNAGFSVERSIDNKKFSEIAFIKGHGTSTEKSIYNYTDKSALSGKYYYRLKQVDFDGTYQYLKSVEVDMGLPKNYALDQNYPNPFNPSTTIRFALPMNATVNIKLYNTLGQEVAIILNNEFSAGVHEAVLNASNFSSGIYFYRLEAKGSDGSVFTSTKRMLLLK